MSQQLSLLLYSLLEIPQWLSGKESTCNAGDTEDVGLIPGSEDPLEKGMATHSSILPGEFHGQRSLVGYSPQGHKESDTTDRLTYTHMHMHAHTQELNYSVF